MPKVRLSGTVRGTEDPGRATRAKLLYLLFNAGWDIYNSNGDQRISLANIERKIVESDAFVFTPGATLEDMFKAVSIFVGYQTLDPNLASKLTVILNSDQSWDPLFRVIEHLHRMGTIKQDYKEFLLSASSPEEVLATLDDISASGLPDTPRERPPAVEMKATDAAPPEDLHGNVCVFCSASLHDPAYLDEGETLGRRLAENHLGCITGAGNSGIMGAVVRGAVQASGWTAGSNVPHIIELEGLPEGLSGFWPRPDIYTRMEVMIQNSDAFVVFPGGAGTIQELLALMIFRHQANPLMDGKPVVLFNRQNESGIGFWDPMIHLLGDLCEPGDFLVVRELEHIVPTIEAHLPAKPTPTP